MKQIVLKTYLSKNRYHQGLLVSLGTIAIILIISNIYWANWFNLASALPAIPQKVFEHNQYWRPFTALFIHADLQHFLSNAWMLLILGYLNYSYFGIGLYPLSALFFSGLTNIVSLLTYTPKVSLLGASGMVYLLGGCWFTLYVLIEKRISLPYRIFRAVAVCIAVMFPTSFEPNISYRTHAIGLIFGVLTGVFIYLTNYRKISQAIIIAEVAEEDEDEDEIATENNEN